MGIDNITKKWDAYIDNYYKDDAPKPAKTRRRVSVKRGIPARKVVAVMFDGREKTFESALTAAAEIGMHEQSIRNACAGKLHSLAGLRWRWADGQLINKKRGFIGRKGERVEVTYPDGSRVVYDTTAEAVAATGFALKTIWCYICNGQKTKSGLKFRRVGRGRDEQAI